MGFGYGPFMRIMDEGFPVAFSVVFWLIAALIAFAVLRGLAEWVRNNRAPRQTANARVVGKRAEVSHHRGPVGGDITGAHGYHDSTGTTWFATFEKEDGGRVEFRLSGKQYGLLVEGDVGELTWQGTRFVDFTRAE